MMLNRQPTPEYAQQLLSYLPTRPDYQTWLNAISAIGNTFDEATAAEILQSHFQDEKPNEIAYKTQKKLQNISFGTLVFLAKQFGYNPEKTTAINRFCGLLKQQGRTNHVRQKKELVKFDGDPELCYRFTDYEIEERAAIYEFDGNLSRLQAEKLVISENPTAERERTYRIGINTLLLNKNLNPKTRQPHPNGQALTTGYLNYYCTLYEIALNVGKGHAILCSHLKADSFGNTHRAKENFVCSDIFAIDIDNKNEKTNRKLTVEEGYMSIDKALSMTETRKALMIYTTPSHTENWHRFRILFPFSRRITDPNHYTKIIGKYIEQYNGDKICKNPVTAYYGNNNATIYLIPSGEVLEFREGEII